MGVDVGVGLDNHYWHDSYDMVLEARKIRFAANLKQTVNQNTPMRLAQTRTIGEARAPGLGR